MKQSKKLEKMPVPPIAESLAQYEFLEVSLGAYYSIERDILLIDTCPRNVRIWQGIPVPFDAIAVNPNQEMKQWMIDKLSI